MEIVMNSVVPASTGNLRKEPPDSCAQCKGASLSQRPVAIFFLMPEECHK
jgi:hypothetical protein